MNSLIEVVLVGSDLGAFAAARNLAKAGHKVLVLETAPLQAEGINTLNPVEPVGIANLNRLSVPFEEKSFKNKTKLISYVDRILGSQTFFLQPLASDSNQVGQPQGGMFFRSLPVGVVLTDQFLQFLKKLALAKNARFVSPEAVKICGSSDEPMITYREEGEKTVEISPDLLVLADLPEGVMDDVKWSNQRSELIRHSFSTPSVLSDSLELFFDPAVLPNGHIAVLPGRQDTYMTVHTKNGSDEARKLVTDLLEQKFHQSIVDLSYLGSATQYKRQPPSELVSPNHKVVSVGSLTGFTTPMTQADLLLRLQTGLVLSDRLSNPTLGETNLLGGPLRSYVEGVQVLQEGVPAAEELWTSLTAEEVYALGEVLSQKNLTDFSGLVRSWAQLKLFLNPVLRSKRSQIQEYLCSVLGFSYWSF